MRIFISADVSNKDAMRKLQEQLVSVTRWSPQKVKPVRKQNFHFTFIFLGETDLQTIDKIKAKLSELQFEPIKITYTGIGGFPNSNYARVIWIGIDQEGGQKLISLAEKVISKMIDIGLRADKRFTPHMTLFRIATGKLKIEKTILSKYADETFGSDIIDKIHLKQSNLTPLGPIYSDIFTTNARLS